MSKLLIKKYDNRKLYDTEKSKYLNLEDIVAYVKSGVDFEVWSCSKKYASVEVTNEVLIQAVTSKVFFTKTELLHLIETGRII